MPDELVIRTEDKKDVRIGDTVYCYYDGYWATITAIYDVFSYLRPDEANEPGYDEPNRNQDFWADVAAADGRTGNFNGQRLSTVDPNGSVSDA